MFNLWTNNKNYSRRILGDATGETGPFNNATYNTQVVQVSSWYSDESWFVNTERPWIDRGSANFNGANAGIFALGYYSGSILEIMGYRITLAF